MRRAFQIIFLDFDGVLNKISASDLRIDFNKPFERENIVALKLILMNHPRARIVISSAWRNHITLEMLKDLLDASGIDRKCVIGVTPYIPFKPRGLEVKAWLESNRDLWKDFVILDDRTDFPGLESFLVKTRSFEGLTEDHALIASEILDGKMKMH